MRSAIGCALLALMIWTDRAVGGVVLRAGSATVDAPGDVADLCVSLDTGGEQIAGTQNDLVWDGNCATLPSVSSCQAAPSLNKQLQGGFPPQFDFTFRALILSFGDVDPIPDGELYCCAFTVETAPGSCCTVDITRAGASDPKGNAIGIVAANSAQLCVRASNLTPLPNATPTPTATIHGDNSGCQVASPESNLVVPLSLALAALLYALRRRLG